MEIYQSIDQVAQQARVIVLGNFDGLHKGHRRLLQRGKELAQKHHLELMALTFFPQPQEIYQENFRYLLSQRLKMQILESLGVDTALVLPFDETIAQISPENFAQEILLEKLHARFVVVGFNYTFGYRGAGTAPMLASFTQTAKVPTLIVEPVYAEQDLVSSTLIRHLLGQGKLEKVRALLGYSFCLDGVVIHGHQVGRTMGIPTANLQRQAQVALPPRGVYAVYVYLASRRLLGVLNVGMRPTVDNGDDMSVEVHILDFNEDIYGEYVIVSLEHWLRGEMKFANLNELKAQITQDMEKTRGLLTL